MSRAQRATALHRSQPKRNPVEPRSPTKRRARLPTLTSMMGKRHSHAATTLPSLAAQHEKVTAMIHGSDSQLSRPLAVRDGQSAPVTCASCGCRLTGAGDTWFHFSPMAGRDARGCRVGCADSAHDASGRADAVPA